MLVHHMTPHVLHTVETDMVSFTVHTLHTQLNWLETRLPSPFSFQCISSSRSSPSVARAIYGGQDAVCGQTTLLKLTATKARSLAFFPGPSYETPGGPVTSRRLPRGPGLIPPTRSRWNTACLTHSRRPISPRPRSCPP